MKRLFNTLFVLALVTGFIAASGWAAAPAFKYDDPIGVIKVKPGEPIHIAAGWSLQGLILPSERIPREAPRSPSPTGEGNFWATPSN